MEKNVLFPSSPLLLLLSLPLLLPLSAFPSPSVHLFPFSLLFICTYVYIYTHMYIYICIHTYNLSPIYIQYNLIPPYHVYMTQKLEFIYKNCIFIFACLNFNHLQSTLHLMQYTYGGGFSTT